MRQLIGAGLRHSDSVITEDKLNLQGTHSALWVLEKSVRETAFV